MQFPCILETVVDGFKSIRKHRSDIIMEILCEEVVTDYKLLALKTEVAVKAEGNYDVVNDKLIGECLRVSSVEEIAKKYIYPHQKDKLMAWKKETLGDAVKAMSDL